MQTKMLDLDAVTSNVDFTLKLNGKEHSLVEPSVEVFISNLSDLEALALNATPSEELEMSIKMIKRSFPSIPEKELRQLKLSQINAIAEFARSSSGQEPVVEEGGETAVGNDQAAS